jgi:hypothetical protein
MLDMERRKTSENILTGFNIWFKLNIVQDSAVLINRAAQPVFKEEWPKKSPL